MGNRLMNAITINYYFIKTTRNHQLIWIPPEDLCAWIESPFFIWDCHFIKTKSPVPEDKAFMIFKICILLCQVRHGKVGDPCYDC